MTTTHALPAPAPADEPLERVALRLAHWMIGTIADKHPAIAETHRLYGLVLAGETVPAETWAANRSDISDVARALGGALARDIASAIDIASALGAARAIDIASASAIGDDIASDIARASAGVALLGDRLEPIPRLNTRILREIETPGHGLVMRKYHTCETTHCRFGWASVIHPLGRELERVFGSWLTGAMIHLRSTGSIPDAFASDEDALADIRLCAALDLLRSALRRGAACVSATKAEIDRMRAENAALRARIDALMLEYCPAEVTSEQAAEWARNQKLQDVPHD